MAITECKKCRGRGFFDVPVKNEDSGKFQFGYEIGGPLFRSEKCDECGGTGKIELRCMAWESSDEKEKLERRVTELAHEVTILQQGIKKTSPT